MTLSKKPSKIISEAVKASCCRRPKLKTLHFAVKATTAGSDSHKMTATDCCLQSTGSKRKYLRRGSKCASMILRAMEKDIANRLRLVSLEQKELDHGQHRRLSLMTALKVSLEKVSIVDHTPSKKYNETLSVEDMRRYTYDLLHEASEL